MLIWDGGLIAVEVGQKQGKNCHAGEITDLVHQDTELVTIGGDGYLRIWETEQLDLASTGVDDSGKCELEPMFELKLAGNSILMSAVRAVNDEANIWFVQVSVRIKAFGFLPIGPRSNALRVPKVKSLCDSRMRLERFGPQISLQPWPIRIIFQKRYSMLQGVPSMVSESLPRTP